jgi:hypothetical protein
MRMIRGTVITIRGTVTTIRGIAIRTIVRTGRTTTETGTTDSELPFKRIRSLGLLILPYLFTSFYSVKMAEGIVYAAGQKFYLVFVVFDKIEVLQIFKIRTCLRLRHAGSA